MPTEKGGGGNRGGAHGFIIKGPDKQTSRKLFSKSQFIDSFLLYWFFALAHRGGLSSNIIIWRIGGGGKFPFALGSTTFLAALNIGTDRIVSLTEEKIPV